MGTQNNLRIPEDLFNRAQRLALSQGRTTDDLAVDALIRYLETQQNLRVLDELATWGQGHAQARGFKESDVERAISEVRRSRAVIRVTADSNIYISASSFGALRSNF